MHLSHTLLVRQRENHTKLRFFLHKVYLTLKQKTFFAQKKHSFNTKECFSTELIQLLGLNFSPKIFIFPSDGYDL